MKVQYVAERGSENFATIADFRAAAQRLRLTETGVVDDPRVNAGLQGLPKFAELAGPMGPQQNGTEVRYETWKAYEIYSS